MYNPENQVKPKRPYSVGVYLLLCLFLGPIGALISLIMGSIWESNIYGKLVCRVVLSFWLILLIVGIIWYGRAY
jgi:hypothetical protein